MRPASRRAASMMESRTPPATTPSQSLTVAGGIIHMSGGDTYSETGQWALRQRKGTAAKRANGSAKGKPASRRAWARMSPLSRAAMCQALLAHVMPRPHAPGGTRPRRARSGLGPRPPTGAGFGPWSRRPAGRASLARPGSVRSPSAGPRWATAPWGGPEPGGPEQGPDRRRAGSEAELAQLAPRSGTQPQRGFYTYLFFTQDLPATDAKGGDVATVTDMWPVSGGVVSTPVGGNVTVEEVATEAASVK